MRSLAPRAMLILALLVAIAPWAPVGAAGPSPQSHLFLSSADRYPTLYATLQSSGARVLHAFPGQGLIAETDPTFAALQVQTGLADYVTAAAVAPDVLAGLSPEAQDLAALWEALRAPAPSIRWPIRWRRR